MRRLRNFLIRQLDTIPVWVLPIIILVWLVMLALFPPKVEGTKYRPGPAQNLEGQVSVLRDRVLQLEMEGGTLRGRMNDLEASWKTWMNTAPYDKNSKLPQRAGSVGVEGR